MSDGNDLFPLFVKLDQVNTLVVGGGKVGLEKVTALLRNDPSARLTIVAREVSADLRVYVSPFSQVHVEERDFRIEDLEDRHLVICATGNPDLNTLIRAACQHRNLLLNIADTPDLCDFYLSSIIRKGDLKIAISTNGKSPTLAKRLRELFDEVFPEEMEDVLLQLSALRSRMKGDLPDKIRRLNKITKMLLEDHDSYDELRVEYRDLL
jgi:siroheme synthase-like protein